MEKKDNKKKRRKNDEGKTEQRERERERERCFNVGKKARRGNILNIPSPWLYPL